MHALMQSVGMVDDHDVGCFMHVNNRKRKNNITMMMMMMM